MRAFGLIVAVTALLSAIALACGTDPVGVDTCRRIETARCESAPACGLDLGRPTHRGDDPQNAVAACIRYYEDGCLHGLEAPEDPGSVRVQACIDAIINGSCEVVKAPETHPDCVWLIPPTPAPAPVATTPPADAATE